MEPQKTDISFVEILGESINFLRRNISTLILCYLLVLTILAILSVLFETKVEKLFDLFGNIAICILVSSIVMDEKSGQPTSFERAMKFLFQKFFIVTWTSIKVWFFTFIRLLLLIVPGINYGVSRQFAGLSIIFKPTLNTCEAREHSSQLVQGRWWKVFIINFLMLGLLIITTIVLTSAALISGLIVNSESLGFGLITLFVSFLINSIIVIFEVHLYLKLEESFKPIS